MTPKNKILLMVFFSVLFVACKKTGVSPVTPQPKFGTQTNTDGSTTSGLSQINAGALVGTWHVVTDTTRSKWFSADYPLGHEYVAIYNGVPADYYNFSANGVFKSSQDNASDSGTFTFSDNKLQLASINAPSWMSPAVWQVSDLTDHSLVLTSLIYTPAGPVTGILTLAR